jgi:AcrR family transcriptional regulator
MPKVSRAHVEARREQIVTAACRCFARKGVHATTMADIRSESGLSTGAIYGHFAGKEAIVRAAADGARERLDAVIEHARESATARRGLEILLAALTECVEGAGDESLESARLEVGLWAGALSSPYLREIMDRWYEAIMPALAELVERMREEEGLPARPPTDAVARAIVATVQGAQLQRAMGEPRPLPLGAVLMRWIAG